MANTYCTDQINHPQPKGGRPIVNHANKRFGKLTVLSFVGFKNGKGNALWLCHCDCGQSRTVSSSKLVAGVTSCVSCAKQSCVKHAMAKKPEYKSWCHAKARCCNPLDPAYQYYGGRGITMCQEWMDSFQAFYDYIGPRPNGTSLDRFPNNNGNYEPGNVRWATTQEQTRNQRTNTRVTYNGETLTIAEWAERTGIKYATLWQRNKQGRPLF